LFFLCDIDAFFGHSFRSKPKPRGRCKLFDRHLHIMLIHGVVYLGTQTYAMDVCMRA
jgi:hypothetical protein